MVGLKRLLTGYPQKFPDTRFPSQKEIAMDGKSIITHITPVGGNIFLDLGFGPEEAAALKADADADLLLKNTIEQSTARFGTDPNGWDMPMDESESEQFMRPNSMDRPTETVDLSPCGEFAG
jgi:hypothetical protein